MPQVGEVRRLFAPVPKEIDSTRWEFEKLYSMPSPPPDFNDPSQFPHLHQKAGKVSSSAKLSSGSSSKLSSSSSTKLSKSAKKNQTEEQSEETKENKEADEDEEGGNETVGGEWHPLPVFAYLPERPADAPKELLPITVSTSIPHCSLFIGPN